MTLNAAFLNLLSLAVAATITCAGTARRRRWVRCWGCIVPLREEEHRPQGQCCACPPPCPARVQPHPALRHPAHLQLPTHQAPLHNRGDRETTVVVCLHPSPTSSASGHAQNGSMSSRAEARSLAGQQLAMCTALVQYKSVSNSSILLNYDCLLTVFF